MLLDLFPSVLALAQHPRPIALKLLVHLYRFYSLKLSTPQERFYENLKLSIGALVA